MQSANINDVYLLYIIVQQEEILLKYNLKYTLVFKYLKSKFRGI